MIQMIGLKQKQPKITADRLTVLRWIAAHPNQVIDAGLPFRETRNALGYLERWRLIKCVACIGWMITDDGIHQL